MTTPAFLPSWVYTSADIGQLEQTRYIDRFWHPAVASADLPDQGVQTLDLLGLPLLITRPGGHDAPPQAFINRCPHRGVALAASAAGPSRRLICPYHGWTYDLHGQLLAAAREADFVAPFERSAWPLPSLPCRQVGPLIWVALTADPVPLEQQLDLVLAEAADLFDRPRSLLARSAMTLACNWKVAHDNTLDDYHVAIAHPTTLHRDQGPVRHYRHRLGTWANLLATPMAGSEFLTFGLPPWLHLLLWPDGRLVCVQFQPDGPERCRLVLWLLGDAALRPQAAELLAQLEAFLEEDRQLMEAAQVGYTARLPFRPGPPHRLEQRIVHHQALYRQLLADSGAFQTAAADSSVRRQ